jgi:8-oxo-dGTP pyrophosphatase MutT (NUDIX family)
MPYVDSYLWRLRQKIGSELVLIPGAMVALRRDDGRILLTRRADDDTWCLPAGAAEPGGSFARTAMEELREETGVEVAEEDLLPIGCLSEAALHTIHYPNGDVTHCFALCFIAERWQGDPRPDQEESIEVRFVELDDLPDPVHPATAHALDLLGAYLASGRFQVR